MRRMIGIVLIFMWLIWLMIEVGDILVLWLSFSCVLLMVELMICMEISIFFYRLIMMVLIGVNSFMKSGLWFGLEFLFFLSFLGSELIRLR